MKILPKIDGDAFQALPEELQESYVQLESGHYLLASLQEGGWESGEDVAGLKTALGRERDAAKEARRENVSLKDAVKTAAQQGNQIAELVSMRKNFKALGMTLEREAKEARLMQAIAQHKAVPLAMKGFLQDKVSFEIEGSQAKVFVRVNDDTTLSVSDYVAELSKAADDPNHPLHEPGLDGLFYNRIKSGGGTPPNGSAPRGGAGSIPHTGLRRSTMSPRAKVDYVKQFGEKALLNLPK